MIKMFKNFKLLLNEYKSKKKFFSDDNKKFRDVVFYSENKIYYLYYEPLINKLLKHSDLNISYITSDYNDPVFQKESDRFKVFYINKLLAFTMPFIDSKVLILTMPEIEKYHIKRSRKNVNHIYVFHAMLSMSMVYNKGAFDHYDTIFCVGQHHYDEFKATEKRYNLKPKELVKVGYPWMKSINEKYNNFLHDKDSENKNPLILIAPSWHKHNIIELCGEELLKNLLNQNYNVVLRPHPEFLKRSFPKLQKIKKMFDTYKNFTMELNLVTDDNFYKSDILITDWSGIAFEYAFGTERPVLFIDTPQKVHNPDYQDIEIVPIDIQLRDKIGMIVKPDEINALSNSISELLNEKSKFQDTIIKLREKYLYNFNNSDYIGAKYIIDYCKINQNRGNK